MNGTSEVNETVSKQREFPSDRRHAYSVSLMRESSESSDAVEHETSPMTNKPFMCDECGARFQYRRNLHVHRKIRHDGQRYKCTKCSVSYTRLGNLRTHHRTVHGPKATSIVTLEGGTVVAPLSSVFDEELRPKRRKLGASVPKRHRCTGLQSSPESHVCASAQHHDCGVGLKLPTRLCNTSQPHIVTNTSTSMAIRLPRFQPRLAANPQSFNQPPAIEPISPSGQCDEARSHNIQSAQLATRQQQQSMTDFGRFVPPSAQLTNHQPRQTSIEPISSFLSDLSSKKTLSISGVAIVPPSMGDAEPQRHNGLLSQTRTNTDSDKALLMEQLYRSFLGSGQAPTQNGITSVPNMTLPNQAPSSVQHPAHAITTTIANTVPAAEPDVGVCPLCTFQTESASLLSRHFSVHMAHEHIRRAFS